MQAGEKKTLLILPNPQPPARLASNPIDLTGASCALKIKNPTNGAVSTVAPVPSFDGTAALYTTTGTEFPVAGTYLIQFFATLPNGNRLESPQMQLRVGASL